MISRQGQRSPSRIWVTSLGEVLGAMLGHFFAILAHFLVVLVHLGFFNEFFVIWARFFMVWGGFWEDLGLIF